MFANHGRGMHHFDGLPGGGLRVDDDGTLPASGDNRRSGAVRHDDGLFGFGVLDDFGSTFLDDVACARARR